MRAHNPIRHRPCWPATLVAAVLVAAVATAAGAAESDVRDDYAEAFRSALTPAVGAFFTALRSDLARTAAPFPERVRRRLRPFFDGARIGGVPLTAAAVERARYTVGAEAARQLFTLTATPTAALTVGDVVAFAPGEYQPDCVEGVALIAHEIVHVAQFTALGRDRFLERYFLTETLQRMLGAPAPAAPHPVPDGLEADAYCVQAEVCRALARSGALPACHGREAPVCRACDRDGRPPSR